MTEENMVDKLVATGILVTATGAGGNKSNSARFVLPAAAGTVAINVPEDACTACVELKGGSAGEHGWAVVAFHRADGTLIERVTLSRESVASVSL
jgi:hypothetical protein